MTLKLKIYQHKTEPKNTSSRSELLQSWYNNLFEHKFIIYRDSHISLVKLRSLTIGNAFDAEIDLICHIQEGNRISYYFDERIYFPLRLWKTQFRIMDEIHRSFCVRSQKPLTFWTEPSFVMYIEKLITYGDYSDAISLIQDYAGD